MGPSRATSCRLCWSALRRPHQNTNPRAIAVPRNRHWTGQSTFFTYTALATTARSNSRRRLVSQHISSPPRLTSSFATAHTSLNLNEIYTRIHDLAATVLKPEDRQLPAEQRVLYVFEQFDALASNLLSNKSSVGSPKSIRENATRSNAETTAISALLGSVNAVRESSNLTSKTLIAHISEQAESIMRNRNVFITPTVLKVYVGLQAKLEQPSSLPDIFQLYANKPVPSLKGGDTSAGVSYATASPNKINAAIESTVANAALTAAIKVNDLALAIDIIHATFCAPAFKRSKILRQALIPISGLAIAPVAAYTLSTSFSTWQNTMSSDYATGLAFAGIMTYVSAVGTMGYITITTANDQMDRVTWAQGVPLWERWIREEERAAIDSVAGAWGFQDLERRGDEDGAEWQGLKEFVGLNGMMLDRVELMDGMD